MHLLDDGLVKDRRISLSLKLLLRAPYAEYKRLPFAVGYDKNYIVRRKMKFVTPESPFPLPGEVDWRRRHGSYRT